MGCFAWNAKSIGNLLDGKASNSHGLIIGGNGVSWI